jgi:putative ABC transport system ATP-binding protein
MGEPALRVEHVTKRVRDGETRRTVVDDVSFHLSEGAVCALRGPSGSGKTTLLAICGAMLSPTSGEVFLRGEPTSRLRDEHRARLRRQRVGLVFQDFQLLEGVTALENVLLPRIPDGVSRADIERAEALLARMGLGPHTKTIVRRLSGGERQRVAYARALMPDPLLLLLDEPTAHLDDAHARQVVDELSAFAAEDRVVLVATHDARVYEHAAITTTLELEAGRLRYT